MTEQEPYTANEWTSSAYLHLAYHWRNAAETARNDKIANPHKYEQRPNRATRRAADKLASRLPQRHRSK